MQFKRKEDEESIKCQKNGDWKAQTIEAKQEREKDKKNILWTDILKVNLIHACSKQKLKFSRVTFTKVSDHFLKAGL